jgi:hypothetical protein
MNQPHPESQVFPSEKYVPRRILKTSIDGLSIAQMHGLDQIDQLASPPKPPFTKAQMLEPEILALPPHLLEAIHRVELDVNPPAPPPLVPASTLYQARQAALDLAAATGRKIGRKRPRNPFIS